MRETCSFSSRSLPGCDCNCDDHCTARRRKNQTNVWLLLDCHFYVRVGPAALEAAAAFTRLIIGLNPQHVLAWRAEGRSRGNGFALLGHRDPRLVESDGAGATE